MRRICVVTGSRADYGPLLALLHALREHPEIDLRLVVTGGHLVRGQGMTVDRVKADGFQVDECLDIVLAGDSPAAVAKSYALAVIGLVDVFDRLTPDILVVLGDRYEAHAAAWTAHLRRLPVAHIHGGELSYGSTDDAARHSITKLAHLHFTANEEFSRRVIQMGEQPDRVFTTGAPSLDTIRSVALLQRGDLEALLGIDLRDPLFAVTYHPATNDPPGSVAGAKGLIEALDTFPHATFVFTGTNVDQEASAIAEMIDAYVGRHPGRAIVVPSLGQVAYLSLVACASAVVGNSSSGLVEAPALGTPTVNIGSRQQGRPRATSVIDSGESAAEIEHSIRQALTPRHQQRSRLARSPWGDGDAAGRIVDVLAGIEPELVYSKVFGDEPMKCHDRS
ncbi:UDP-N-acetylglucosamine 2-epimerase [Phytoactinopolyspora limicola]|uniref:UDP-N-acetylglucosamine 2-epimerase n=1 Tax=Phytoactinopolyspora limicola TaxID=2715536 RepID=UPI001407FCD0|nr:UDP-N-acetylglucosamine 2-epimerase [Phytoactinopolyspora limicola]